MCTKRRNLSPNYKAYVKQLKTITNDLAIKIKQKSRTKREWKKRSLSKKISSLQEQLKNLKNKYPKRKGPICSRLEAILVKHKIAVQSYHSRSFVGNHCHKYLSPNTYEDLAQHVVKTSLDLSQNENLHVQTSYSAQIFKHLNKLFQTIHSLISHSNKIEDSSWLAIDKSIKTYMSFYRRKIKSPVFPKIHFLEYHCLNWIKKYGFGLGLHSEHGGEQLHRSIAILESQCSGISRDSDRLISVMHKHFAQVSPELLSDKPKTKSRKQKRT